MSTILVQHMTYIQFAMEYNSLGTPDTASLITTTTTTNVSRTINTTALARTAVLLEYLQRRRRAD